jgi:glyoxylase-like metal-dependent hydrolase (beta-lactamase superfamily II)
MATHVIKPLWLAKTIGEKGPMTYLTNNSVPIVRPYVMWYIKADGKNILVDTAIEAHDYQNYHPGFKSLSFEALQSFEEALAKVGCAPEDIDMVIHTHLHMDHVYNTLKCKNAVVLVQEDELKFARDPHPVMQIMYPQEIIAKMDCETLKGDQTIVPGIEVMLLPGHTPGCQGVVIDTAKGKAVITGCCSIMDNFTPPEDVKTTVSPFATYPVITPGIHSDTFQAYDSALKIKQIADIIIPMHDPEMAAKTEIP